MTNPLLRHSSWCKEIAFNCNNWCRRPAQLQMIRLYTQKHSGCLHLQRKNMKLIEMVQLKCSQTLGSYREASPLLRQDMCHQQQPRQDQVQPFSCFYTPWPGEHPLPNRAGLQLLYLLCPLASSSLVIAVISVFYTPVFVLSQTHSNKVIILKSHPWKSD